MMKKSFYACLLGLLVFEIANVFFIMPMPGSQDMNSIELAYFLYRWRWVFRMIFGVMILAGFIRSRWKRKYIPLTLFALVGAVTYMLNFVMTADHMFYQPSSLIMKPASENKTDTERLVIGVMENGEARAYPIRYIGYHHQVVDTVGGKPVIVTYCTVCRTGRVYEPKVNEKYEKFRLVGMDHFNAMFEDHSTGSWWRQVNGEAITGKLKGKHLPEILSTQTSLKKWLELYPQSLIMQADPAYEKMYDSSFNYESGKSRKKLTGTDSLSWKRKSWVVGVKHKEKTKAYDWNELLSRRVIIDRMAGDEISIVLASDNKSFFAFETPVNSGLRVQDDTIFFNNRRYQLNGAGIDTLSQLKRIPAYQEFWHSWQEFNKESEKFEVKNEK